MDTSFQKGVLFILLSTLLFGSYGIWSRLIGSSLGVFSQGWIRALAIVIIVLPILLYKKELVRIEKKDWGWMAAFLIFTSLTQAPIFYAYNHMDIATASLLYFVATIITMYLIGFIFLGERFTSLKVISFIIACIGLAFIFSISLANFALLAAVMALLNGIASGGELAFSKKLSDTYSSLFIIWLSWLIIVITNAPVSFFTGELTHIPGISVVWFLVAGYTVASLFGFWLVIIGLKYVEASIGGLISLLEIVFSIFFGVVIFKETFTLKMVFGALLILLAAALPYLPSSLKRKTPQG